MNWMNIARVAKVVALLAFLMPWLVVSCQGAPLASATGLDLATGSIKAMGEQSSPDASPQWWALLALLAIIGGLAASFLLKPARRAVLALGGSAVAALLLCVFGMMLTIADGKSRIAEEQGGEDAFAREMQQAAVAAIRFETRFGYWLALLALAGAGGSAFMLYRGRAVPVPITQLGDRLKAAATDIGKGGAAADPDSAYWDAMPDKTDRAALEEYIYRFPEGRFVELARSRLAGTPQA